MRCSNVAYHVFWPASEPPCGAPTGLCLRKGQQKRNMQPNIALGFSILALEQAVGKTTYLGFPRMFALFLRRPRDSLRCHCVTSLLLSRSATEGHTLRCWSFHMAILTDRHRTDKSLNQRGLFTAPCPLSPFLGLFSLLRAVFFPRGQKQPLSKLPSSLRR